jgi:hypothetical protein
LQIQYPVTPGEEEIKQQPFQSIRTKLNQSRNDADLHAILVVHFNNLPEANQLKTCCKVGNYKSGCDPTGSSSRFSNVLNPEFLVEATECDCITK